MASYEVSVFKETYGEDTNEDNLLVHHMVLQADEMLVHRDSVSFQSNGNSVEFSTYRDERLNHVIAKGNKVSIHIITGYPNE